MNSADRVPFRSTWADSVPATWGQVKLGHIARIYAGGTPDKKNDAYWVGGTIPWINSGSVNQGLITDPSEYITEAGYQNSSARFVPIGALVVALAGQGKTKGMVAQMGIEATCNQSMAAIVVEEDDPRYIMYWLTSNYRNIRGIASDDLRDGLNLQHVANIPCPRPPRIEQEAISSYLDAETVRIDGLIAAKSELLTLLRGLDASAFLSALALAAQDQDGHPDSRLAWLSKLPESWARCKLKHLVVSFDQGVSPQCESQVPDANEWGVLKVGCVNSGRFNPAESKALPPEIRPIPEVTVEEGDLLISRANTKDLVGRSAVAAQSFPKLMLSDKLYRLKLDTSRCLPEFVRRVMWIPAVRQRIEERATGASPSMLNIDRRTILELTMPLPPIEEQRAILRQAEVQSVTADELVRHVEHEIDLLKELRCATITDAVLGRIDVRKHIKY